MKLPMPRLLTFLFAALLGLFLAPMTFAASAPILQRPYDLDTGHGVLRGTLLLPQRASPPPLAILVAGSGPTDRDGNNPEGGNNAYLRRLAEALAANGVASVRYDKRGIARSRDAGPDERQLSLDGYVDDLVAWSDRLAEDPRFGPQVLVGHSEGALIASLAAPRSKATALALISGSGRPIDKVLREQLSVRLPPPLLARADTILDQLRAGRQVAEVPPQLTALFRPSVQPYLISLFRHDPARALAEVRQPTLILQGTSDIQVDVADAQALARAKPDAELRLIGGMNHVLRIVPADVQKQLASYNDPGLPLARELVERLVTFIQRGAAQNPPSNSAG
ncbi:alpha/beta hydrolase [Pseudomonas citronellolis]|uniref:alpha/beta hydrolase n=1 Tax=Pseudomonas citronellolis TaxID=53408 RepID=UPI0023E380B8|nr:alpha/beta fold hydrolase [Pseudomonas citronellolis]MDF3934506.1 alpha/beta fold hydrolase [Pseudomonas citronellolis]